MYVEFEFEVVDGAGEADDPNLCRMTYMRPYYSQVPLPDEGGGIDMSSRYKLWLYREQLVHNLDSEGMPNPKSPLIGYQTLVQQLWRALTQNVPCTRIVFDVKIGMVDFPLKA